ncbi:Apple domain-containing protein [Balamuthia mandrillaris]
MSYALTQGPQGRAVTLVNECATSRDIYWNTELLFTLEGNGGEGTWTIPAGPVSGKFQHGTEASATLAEFSFNTGFSDLDFYDISVIPPGCPGDQCFSYQCCVDVGGETGYNGPMRLQSECHDLYCLGDPSVNEDNCADAYCKLKLSIAWFNSLTLSLSPKDDENTHACSDEGDYTITFCPEGSIDSGSSTGTADGNSDGEEDGTNEDGNEDGGCGATLSSLLL